MGGYAWVTLATNDSYSLGALVLAHSLRRVGSQHDLVVLITPGVSQSMREKLISVFTLVREVNVLDSKDEANLEVLQRPELGITFTKLHCWRLTQYDKCVFIDADALVVKNCDELFEREELSAAPDVGWPDCFNSGVFVFKPSQQTFALLIQFAASHGSFDGADQGLLNMYFSDWAHKDISKHLPFIYNMCSVASYSYAPAFNVYGKNVRIVHFIGATKPWLQYFDTLTGIVQPPANCGHVQPLLQVWWNIFHNNVQSELSGEMGGLAGTLSRLTIGEVRAEDQKAIEDHIRKQNWEQGQIDYMGKDSFDNILKKINETVELASLEKTSAVEEIQQPKKTGSKDSEVEAAVEKSEVVLPEIEDEAQSQKIQLPPDNGLTSTKNAEPQIESTSVTEVKETDGTNLQQTTISTQNIFDLIKSTDGFQITDQLTQTVTPSVVLLMPEVLDVKQAKSLKQNIDAESIQQVTETSPEAVINTTVSNISLSSILSESQSEKSDETVQINETLNLPETVTECPVPIQVAESVLQAEPKESVSENLKSTTDEVTSTISSLKKSAVADTDTLTELKQTDLNQCSSISPPLNSENNLLKTEENKNVTLLTLDTTLVASNSKIVSAAPEISQRTQEEIQSSEKSQLPSEVAAQIEEVPVQEAESVQETAKLVLPITPQCVEEITELPKVDSLAPKETPLPMQNTQTLVQEVQSVGVETGSALQETGLTSLEPQSGMQKMELTSQEKIPEPEDGSCIVKPDESISQKSKLTVKLPQPELSKEHNLTENKDLTTNLNRSFEGEILEKKDSKMTSPTEIDESLVESNTIKDIKVPGTPIVIEPTPPTSPPFEIKADQVTQEKTQEKTKKETEVEKQIEVSSTEATAAQEIEKLDHLKQESDSETTESAVKTEEKKSSAESDSPSSPEIEGTSKSIGNSNVKKVSKKPNESEEAKESSSIDKPTKIPKTAKKLTKTPSSTSLDADRSVPETPPPSGAATSQVPVPPKRKTKNNSSTKTSSKK